MKIILIFVVAILLLFILSVPCHSQEGIKDTITVTRVSFVAKSKAHIEGILSSGERVYLKMGFSKWEKEKLIPGALITISRIPGRKIDGYSPAILRVE